jgi:hypothetical protein
MRVRPIQLLAIAVLLAGLTACRDVDLREAIEITDVASGWHDNGLRDGWTHFVPSLTFRIKNTTTVPVANVALTVSFWKEGEDGEYDEVLLRGVLDAALQAGETGEPIVVRGNVGYNLEGARAELFSRSPFKDVVAKIFARRGGRIVPKGEFKIERRILAQSPSPGSS